MSFDILEFLLVLFGVTYTVSTLILLAISLYEMAWLARGRLPSKHREFPARSPTVSLIVPAHNEEPLIVNSVTSFLQIDYPGFEVVVCDDGSTDGTFDRLDEAFDLVNLPLRGRTELQTARITGVYISRRQPALMVVKKENGGRSDAINAGLCVARGELAAITDADGILEPDAISRIIRPYEVHPDTCVAVGGAIRIANGSTIEDGRIVASRVATRGIPATQTLEYLRGFLSSRIAWSRINGLLIISGAFGVFRRDLLIGLGGLSKATLGEDMELTMRFHHLLRPTWKHAAVFYVPDAVCWTECPAALSGLRTQRIRWHVGLIDNLRLHWRMFGRARFGAAGTLALPYIIAYEAIAPFLELSGYVVGAFLVLTEPNGWQYLASFVIVTVFLGQVLNATALLIAEVGARRYTYKDMLSLSLWGVVESLWYRPANAWWRVKATVLVLIGRRPGWGTIPRGVSLVEPATDIAAPLTR
jgi:cellulose synthase/poly-beta-1,6-N-acetylglucosamine synthase-like glycosyltransferase